jgi:hypothetical protein
MFIVFVPASKLHVGVAELDAGATSATAAAATQRPAQRFLAVPDGPCSAPPITRGIVLFLE